MAEVEERRLGLESTKRELEEQLAQLRADRAQIVEEFRLEAREMMRKAERQITQLQQSLKHGKVKPHKPREALKNISGEIVHVLGTPLEPSVTALEVGSRVKIKSLGRVGTVKGVLERGNVEVAVGNVTVRTNAEDLVLLDEGSEQKNASKKKQIGVDIPAVTPQWEVKVIGLRVEEALPIVEKALDKALVGGLRSISIIHGKGTGRLRQAVRDYLSQHALVRSFRSEDIRGGGEGVTVVELVSE
jgi:DNA mismatch repair protein MutS2